MIYKFPVCIKCGSISAIDHESQSDICDYMCYTCQKVEKDKKNIDAKTKFHYSFDVRIMSYSINWSFTDRMFTYISGTSLDADKKITIDWGNTPEKYFNVFDTNKTYTVEIKEK